MFLRSTLLIAGVGLAVAQSISSNCSTALITIATSPQATCLDLTLLAPLLTSNSSNTSIIPTVNSWLTGMCSQGACTNASLQAITTNLTNGCAGELASFGITNVNNATTVVEIGYPIFREIVCLEDTSANSLCVTELLTGVQSATTTLSISNVVNLFSQMMSANTFNIPQNVTCSNCSKAAYTILAENFPSIKSNQTIIQSECGTSFTNGQMPSNIQETASNSSSSSSSTGGAISLSVSSFNIGLALLIAVSSTFAIFV